MNNRENNRNSRNEENQRQDIEIQYKLGKEGYFKFSKSSQQETRQGLKKFSGLARQAISILLTVALKFFVGV